MATITIRRIDDRLKATLKARAAAHGRSIAEEARLTLTEALDEKPPQSLGDIGRELFGPKHGIELEPHPPVVPREPPKFD